MQEDSFHNIIRSIDKFSLSTDFVDWFSEGDFRFSIVSEINCEMRYSRQIKFTVEDRLILVGCIDLIKASIEERVLDDFFKEQIPIGRYMTIHPESYLSKHILSRAREGDRYQIDSTICYSNATCGTCKEVFFLDNIALLDGIG